MYLIVKRFFDILLSIIGIVILLPLFLIVAIAIKLDSKGPLIFKQKRLGQGGVVFEIYKFRTMVIGAEQMGSGVYCEKGDPRVSRVGKVLRNLSIDELAQFINVLKGDMSLIGPRPPLTYHPWNIEDYTEEQKKRFLVKPGVTGWAQIHGRKSLQWEERIRYDVEYVENLSFWIDLKIFFKTIIKIITMEDNQNIGETVIQSSVNSKVKAKM